MRWRARVIAAGYTLLAIAIVNFVAFLAITSRIGGDALNGKIEGGRYYLGKRGGYTEVPRDTWVWSKAHSISVCVTHPLGVAGGVAAHRARLRGWRRPG